MGLKHFDFIIVRAILLQILQKLSKHSFPQCKMETFINCIFFLIYIGYISLMGHNEEKNIAIE